VKSTLRSIECYVCHASGAGFLPYWVIRYKQSLVADWVGKNISSAYDFI